MLEYLDYDHQREEIYNRIKGKNEKYFDFLPGKEVKFLFDYFMASSKPPIIQSTCIQKKSGDEVTNYSEEETYILSEDKNKNVNENGKKLVIINDPVKNIENVFKYWGSLIEVQINSKVLEIIGDYTFHSCCNLTTINFPVSLKKIGCYTFDNCKSLSNVVFPSSLEEIESHAFRGTSIISVIIPPSVKTINTAAFNNCKSLEFVKIPSSVSFLGDYVFRNCPKLSKVEFDESINIKAIQDYAFSECNSLEFIIIPESVTYIGIDAFRDCISLKKVVFPKGLETIKTLAFLNTKLTEVTLPKNVNMEGFPFYQNIEISYF